MHPGLTCLNLLRYLFSSFYGFIANFLSAQSSPDSWNMVFIIGSIFYIVPTFIFWVFGTAEVQPWNEIRKEGRQAPGVVIQK